MAAPLGGSGGPSGQPRQVVTPRRGVEQPGLRKRSARSSPRSIRKARYWQSDPTGDRSHEVEVRVHLRRHLGLGWNLTRNHDRLRGQQRRYPKRPRRQKPRLYILSAKERVSGSPKSRSDHATEGAIAQSVNARTDDPVWNLGLMNHLPSRSRSTGARGQEV